MAALERENEKLGSKEEVWRDNTTYKRILLIEAIGLFGATYCTILDWVSVCDGQIPWDEAKLDRIDSKYTSTHLFCFNSHNIPFVLSLQMVYKENL